MPSNLKKRVHERMQKTGESYRAALHQVRKGAAPTTLHPLLAQLVELSRQGTTILLSPFDYANVLPLRTRQSMDDITRHGLRVADAVVLPKRYVPLGESWIAATADDLDVPAEKKHRLVWPIREVFLGLRGMIERARHLRDTGHDIFMHRQWSCDMTQPPPRTPIEGDWNGMIIAMRGDMIYHLTFTDDRPWPKDPPSLDP